MRLPLAVLAALSTTLLAAECELPFGPEEGHSILYLHLLPQGSSFVYPGEEEFVAAAEEVRAYFLEASYGQYRLQGDGDPASPGDIIGPLVTPVGFECDLEEFFVEQAVSSLGHSIDFRRYEHVAVVAPGVGCGFNGLYVGRFQVPVFGEITEVDAVYVNAQTLYFTGNGTSGPGVVAHELGHLLGLSHSRALRCDPTGVAFDAGCDDGEYLDFIDVMGSSAFFGHYNAFQKLELGWLPQASVFEVTESGRYFLTPFESRSLGPKVLRIPRQSDSWLTVEYRTATGFDDHVIPGFTNGAVVHLVRPLDTRSAVLQSFLLIGPANRFALGTGETMLDVRGHTISVVAKTPGGILLDVELAPAAELEPPSLSFSVALAGAGLGRITVSAEDPSGIDRVEVYARRPGVSRFDWTVVEPLGEIPAAGETSFVGELIVDRADLFDGFEVLAFDQEGNVARELR
jgi:hypothetical protein